MLYVLRFSLIFCSVRASKPTWWWWVGRVFFHYSAPSPAASRWDPLDIRHIINSQLCGIIYSKPDPNHIHPEFLSSHLEKKISFWTSDWATVSVWWWNTYVFASRLINLLFFHRPGENDLPADILSCFLKLIRFAEYNNTVCSIRKPSQQPSPKWYYAGRQTSNRFNFASNNWIRESTVKKGCGRSCEMKVGSHNQWILSGGSTRYDAQIPLSIILVRAKVTKTVLKTTKHLLGLCGYILPNGNICICWNSVFAGWLWCCWPSCLCVTWNWCNWSSGETHPLLTNPIYADENGIFSPVSCFSALLSYSDLTLSHKCMSLPLWEGT